MQISTFADMILLIFLFLFFEVNQVFMKVKDNSVEKVVIDEEELDGIDIDGILILKC